MLADISAVPSAPSVIAGPPKHIPEWKVATAALPFPFDSTATCPQWEEFLQQTIGEEAEKIELLREWFGYCMTPDTGMQKMMFLRGPSGTAKSVILNTLCRLIGCERAISMLFSRVLTSSGTKSLLGKTVCVIHDARGGGGEARRNTWELLKSLTSGAFTIDRSYLKPLMENRACVRFTFASDDFLDIPREASPILPHLCVIDLACGREDFGLEDKLATEIPGIAVWALQGLRNLREQGRFTVPPSSQIALSEWRTSTSPLAAFLEECTDETEGGEVLKQELYDCWSKWSVERGMTVTNKAKFSERIKANAPFIVPFQRERQGERFQMYRGIRLKDNPARASTGKRGNELSDQTQVQDLEADRRGTSDSSRIEVGRL